MKYKSRSQYAFRKTNKAIRDDWKQSKFDAVGTVLIYPIVFVTYYSSSFNLRKESDGKYVLDDE